MSAAFPLPAPNMPSKHCKSMVFAMAYGWHANGSLNAIQGIPAAATTFLKSNKFLARALAHAHAQKSNFKEGF